MSLTHSANLGSVSMTEKSVATGRGPHVYRTHPLQSGLGELPDGLLMALDADAALVPWNVSQEATASGDAAAVEFSFDLGGPLEPCSVSVTDGTETFSDDGFGNLTGSVSGTGTVNYATGQVAATFAAAPAEGTGNVSCAYDPAVYGVLNRPTPADAVMAEVVVFGPVDRKELLQGAEQTALTLAQLRQLDHKHIWPIG